MAIEYGTAVKYIGENQIYRDHGVGKVDGIIEASSMTVVLVKYRELGIKLKFDIDDLEEVKEEKKITITRSEFENKVIKTLEEFADLLAIMEMLNLKMGPDELSDAIAQHTANIERELFGDEDGD